MKKYLVSLDQGTTSSRTIIFDRDGNIVASAQYPYSQYFPNTGWVEHDAAEILETQFRSLRDAVAKAGIVPDEIAGIGITNQRETTVAWNKETGEPICHAIVWQCRRTADICENLIKSGEDAYIKTVTGLPVDAYFSGTKAKWILDNVPGARELADKGKLAFGTIDSWLIWNLTDGALHITDVSNASRTMVFDIEKLCYDKRLLDILGIPEDTLPEVRSSGELYGEISTEKFSLGSFRGVPICAILGDQQAALFGQKCFGIGDVKNTYGTGCFTLMNIGENGKLRAPGLITTVGWQYGDRTVWALEGSVFNGGSSIQWLREQLGIITAASECDALAETVSDNGGVYLVSAFNGLGAPYWDMYARGGILGITRGTTKAHIARATLEGIAYQVYDLVTTMEASGERRITSLRADGGASASRFMMQFQADILGADVVCPPVRETTALGAAFMAGLASGFYRDESELPKFEQSTVYKPNITDEEREKLLSGWKKAVSRVTAWEEK